MKKLNIAVCFIPIAIYCVYLSFIQVRVGGGFFISGLGLSFLPTIFYLLYVKQLWQHKVALNIKALLVVSLFLAAGLCFFGYAVGDDKESALISGVAIHTITAFIFAFVSFSRYGPKNILIDAKTGAAYRVLNGVAYPLSDIDMKSFVTDSGKTRIYDFAEGSIPVSNSSFISAHDANSNVSINPSSGLPMNDGSSGFDTMGNSWGSNFHDTSVNPSTGLPMNGGMSGLDVGGNSWGTNFNDPSGSQNSYDPNRGY